jgi:hypothetical protein
MADAAAWRLGYARQAKADFRMYQALEADPAAETCHRLQFLQMACEKLVKAFLCSAGEDPGALLSSHAYVKAHLPTVLRQEAVFRNFTGPGAREVLRRSRHLAEEIDVLAPAVKRGGRRPDNCEYPWEDAAGTLHVPLDWSFQPAQLVVIPSGRTILKLIQGAIDRLVP